MVREVQWWGAGRGQSSRDFQPALPPWSILTHSRAPGRILSPVGLGFSKWKEGGHNPGLSSSATKAAGGGLGLRTQAEEKGHCQSLCPASPARVLPASPAACQPRQLPGRCRGERSRQGPILSPETRSLLAAGTAPWPH